LSKRTYTARKNRVADTAEENGVGKAKMKAELQIEKK